MSSFLSLGTGHSSVAGFSWFLVGRDHETAFWVTLDDSADARDPHAYSVHEFLPGRPQQDSPPAEAVLAGEVATFCTGVVVRHDLEFSDLRRARDLYWAYKSLKNPDLGER